MVGPYSQKDEVRARKNFQPQEVAIDWSTLLCFNRLRPAAAS